MGLFTSPPHDDLELALKRAADLKRKYKGAIERIVKSEGYSSSTVRPAPSFFGPAYVGDSTA
jgi:hypothetical protein